MLLAITPTGGMAAVGGTIGAPTGPPVAAGSTATLYRMDPGGGFTSLGQVVLYNVSPVESVPGGVPATVDRASGGNYFCRTWLGQASPNAVLIGGQPYQAGF